MVCPTPEWQANHLLQPPKSTHSTGTHIPKDARQTVIDRQTDTAQSWQSPTEEERGPMPPWWSEVATQGPVFFPCLLFLTLLFPVPTAM